FSALGGTAVSLANESQIVASDWPALLAELNAVLVWSGGGWVGSPDLRAHQVLKERNPAMTIAELGRFRDPALPRFRALIITALQEEYEACLRVFQPAHRDDVASIAFLEPGSSGQRLPVRLVCVGKMGSIESAIATTRWLLDSEAP